MRYSIRKCMDTVIGARNRLLAEAVTEFILSVVFALSLARLGVLAHLHNAHTGRQHRYPADYRRLGNA